MFDTKEAFSNFRVSEKKYPQHFSVQPEMHYILDFTFFTCQQKYQFEQR